MGAWGTDLLEDDDAADVAGTFIDAIEAGATVEQAIAGVMEEYEFALDDMDSRPNVILALAWLASERGTVPEWLEAEAREIVAREVTLARWKEDAPADVDERRAVEAQLIAVLDGSIPHPGRPDWLVPDAPEA